jgi:Flp pilus assembly protein TadG
MSLLRRALKDQRGASVVEFALVAPAFLMIIIGGLYLGMAGLAASSLRYAVQAGARCASVNTTVCSSNSATVTYTTARYKGAYTPTFVSSTATCGHLVTGTMTFRLDTGIKRIDIPLSAQSCFP